MINEIKIYKELVEVQITDFAGNIEVLYWEGDIQEFSNKYQSIKAISFPIHGGRVVDVNRIQGFEKADPEIKTLQNMICSFTHTQQETIKLQVKEYKKRNKVYPSGKWLENIINAIVYPELQQLREYEKELESKKIREHKFKLLNFIQTLSVKEELEIEKEAWNKVFDINPDYIGFEHRLSAKSLFIAIKNEIIENLMNKIGKN